ncbi:uncharacterized protein LOC135160659 [Diachasmimorpha longicaudata]|uniref:uncharacterized protein LOC135160659 n=1 Tax=Diachasmimorpha longicaudata TaxID=58733 RepID=UPI0030B8B062
MTRFARAKGSKASNERLPDEPTPWHMMKQQLECSMAFQQSSPSQRTKSAKELLKEQEEPFYCNGGAVVHDWAEFPEKKVKSLISNQSKDSHGNFTSKNISNRPLELNLEHLKHGQTQVHSENNVSSSKKSKKRKSITEYTPQDPTDNFDVREQHSFPWKESTDQNTIFTLNPQNSSKIKSKINAHQTKKQKINEENILITLKKSEMRPNLEKGSSQISSADYHFDNCQAPPKNVNLTPREEGTLQALPVKLSKRQKRNRKNKLTKSEEQSSVLVVKNEDKSASCVFNTESNEWSNEIKLGNTTMAINSPEENNKFLEDSDRQQNELQKKTEGQSSSMRADFIKSRKKLDKQKVVKKQKLPKIRDDKEHKRRKPTSGPTKIIINGLEIEIVMYDGFPVKKEDAERLMELRREMVMKGIPKAEINAAMKLERRKAEKALSRIKKNVCFHCRKAGHNLSDCPDLGKEEAAIGICFKCGSTEHTHFECRVTKKEEFGFAKCFICREQGHIAKQCPDNPKGLYPQGGSCKICGDVTHLKKNCPDLMQDKEESTLTVASILDNAVEDLVGERRVQEKKEEKQKVVTF